MAKLYTPSRLSENIAETPEGFLFCLGVRIARTGWQKYGPGEHPLEGDKNGMCNVYRSAEEVFRPETIASFQGKSITIRHPEDFVAPHNWKDLSHGTVQNVRRAEGKDEDGEESLLADLLITDQMAIGLVKHGLREVSCGYEAEYEQTGEGEGRQLNIVGNHVALVEEGRAGSTYAINDHKGKVIEMDPKKLLERLRAKLGAKVVDEAMAEEKKEESKDAPTVSNEAYDEMKKSYDEMKKSFDAWAEKMEGKGKDEPDPKDKPAPDKPAKDEDSEGDATVESRLTAIETAVAKLLQAKAGDEDDDGDETDDEEDDDSTMTGDTAARVEILAPGLKRSKGEKEDAIKVKALDAAYATKDGKAVIDILTGGKKPGKENAGTLFIAASEVLKSQRGSGLDGTKSPLNFKVTDGQVEDGVMTAEKMNEINAAHYGRK